MYTAFYCNIVIIYNHAKFRSGILNHLSRKLKLKYPSYTSKRLRISIPNYAPKIDYNNIKGMNLK